MLSTLNKISESHNTCEDSLFVIEDAEMIFGVVSDGCSTGICSAFASQAVCYSVRKILKENDYKTITSDSFVVQLSIDLLRLKNSFLLSEMNLLATCVLFDYNKFTKELNVRSFGDSYYYVNSQEYVVDQNNTPDYLGYHLEELGTPKFVEFVSKYESRTYYRVESFQICSDGIKSFKISQFKEDAGVNPETELLKIPVSENYLSRAFNILKRKGFTISDDLSIVSYVQD